MDSLDNNILNQEQTKELKNNAQRAKIAGYVFLGIAVLSIAAALSSWLEWDLLIRINEGGEYTEDEAARNDMRQAAIAIINIVLTIASIVTFLNWFRRAYGNMERAGVNNLLHEEKQAMYSFMIPIVSLYRPYQITKEISEKTQRKIQELTPDYEIKSASALIIVWWTFYIITNIIGNIVFRVVLKAETIEEMIRAAQVSMISDLLTIPAAIATYFLIKNIAKKEAVLFDLIEKEKLKSIYTSQETTKDN